MKTTKTRQPKAYTPPVAWDKVHQIGAELQHTCHRCGAYAKDDQLEMEIASDVISPMTVYYVHRGTCP